MIKKIVKIEKLVRDHIPKILRQKGIEVHERILENDEFIAKLKEKLQEEAEEVKHALSPVELTEELADMLEVIYTLSRNNGITLEEIEKARLIKIKTNGGFDKRIYNSFVEVEIGNPAMEYYLKNGYQISEVETIPYKKDCLFCQFSNHEMAVAIVETFPHCYAIKDRYPVSEGHLLIIPKEHTDNWFTAREEVRLDMMKALNHLKSRLDMEYQPDGYNIGMNCGEVAGQSIMHLHMHLIPRYKGDMENPKGGVRGVIPSKQSY